MAEVKRRCTDIWCFLVFAVAVAGLGWIISYALTHGDMRRLYHGFNNKGQLCGVDAAVKTLPYLYYCSQITGTGLNIAQPICVDTCPTSTGSMLVCSSGAQISYATHAVGSLCMPNNAAKMAQLVASRSNSTFVSTASKVTEVSIHWQQLAIICAIGFILGYVYLFLIRLCPEGLVYGCLGFLISTLILVGTYLIFVAKFKLRPSFGGFLRSGNDDTDFYVGIGCICLGALFLILTCCLLRSMRIAIGCIKAATECMQECPSLLLNPLVELVLKLSVWFAMLLGFCQLVSCGKLASHHGAYRTFTYENVHYCYMAYYIFMMFWVLELFTSLSQFSIAYAVQLWYFTPYKGNTKVGVPAFGLFKGYFTGFLYHLGTLLIGAFLIAIFRFVRLILSSITSAAKDTGNCVGACIVSCCNCIVACFQRVVEFINKNAYIEVAINSDNFCSAARQAVIIIAKEAAAIGVLNGATLLLQIAGVGVIAGAGAGLTWLMCTELPPFKDPSSSHYVGDPGVLTVAAAVVCGVIGLAFVIVFDTVSDTILYCYATHRQTDESSKKNKGLGFLLCAHGRSTSSSEGQFTPPELRNLLGS